MVLYFAYGSNLDEAQMAARCQSAQRQSIAFLSGYRFVFRASVPLESIWGLPASDRQRAKLARDYCGASAMQILLPLMNAKVIRFVTIEKIVTVKDASGTPHDAWLYFKKDDVPLNPPCNAYYQQVLKAYATHGFEQQIVHDAYDEAVDFIAI